MLKKELTELVKQLAESNELTSDTRGKLLQIKNDSDFKTLLQTVTEDNQLKIIVNYLGDKSIYLLNKVSDIKNVFKYLSEEQRDLILNNHNDIILPLVKNAEDFNKLLKYLKEKERGVVFNLLQDNLLSLVNHEGDLLPVLEYLSERNKNEFLKNNQDLVFSLIETINGFGWFFSNLSIQEKEAVYSKTKNKLPKFIRSASDLSFLFALLNAEQIGNFVNEIYLLNGKNIQPWEQIIDSLSDLFLVVESLTLEQATLVFETMVEAKKLRSFFTVKMINDSDSLAGRYATIKYPDQYLSSFFMSLSIEKLSALLKLLDKNLIEIFPDANFLAKVLKLLEPKTANCLFESIKDKLPWYLEKGNNFDELASSVSSTPSNLIFLKELNLNFTNKPKEDSLSKELSLSNKSSSTKSFKIRVSNVLQHKNSPAKNEDFNKSLSSNTVSSQEKYPNPFKVMYSKLPPLERAENAVSLSQESFSKVVSSSSQDQESAKIMTPLARRKLVPAKNPNKLSTDISPNAETQKNAKNDNWLPPINLAKQPSKVSESGLSHSIQLKKETITLPPIQSSNFLNKRSPEISFNRIGQEQKNECKLPPINSNRFNHSTKKMLTSFKEKTSEADMNHSKKQQLPPLRPVHENPFKKKGSEFSITNLRITNAQFKPVTSSIFSNPNSKTNAEASNEQYTYDSSSIRNS